MQKTYSIKDFLEVKSSTHGTFSPDGMHVAYLSNSSGTNQIFLISSTGGTSEQLTNYPDPIEFVLFSPTDNYLIFGKADGGNEQTQFYIFNLNTRKITDITSNPKVKFNFGFWSLDGDKICYSSNERNGKDFDVYVLDIKTFERRSIYDKGGSCYAAGFSPKSTYVVVKRNHSNLNSDIYLCNLKTSEIEHITPHEGVVLYSIPRWLPDESAFYLANDKDREFMGLSKYSFSNKKFEHVLTPEWDIDGTAIDRTGNYLAITINEDGYNKTNLYDTQALKKLEYTLPPGNISQIRFAADSTKILFSAGDSRTTTDIWIFELKSKKYFQLTHSHQGVPPEVMVEAELIKYKSFDGLTIPAFIYRPKNISDAKIPTIIMIHGGPEGQYQTGYGALTQYFIYSGYAVIGPNVRGSSGYGKTYLGLDDIEKRMDSVKDIVALKKHLETISFVDTDKIVLYGASYGGFMVLAGLTFYPDLWAAGIDVVGISNFVTFLESTAPYRRSLREAEYGSLENNRKFLEEISPINSIEKIQAPLFIIHGANDPRVPLSETEQVVQKLKKLEREVELLVYADEGHGLKKLKNKLDAYPKVIAFLEKILN